MTSFTNDHILHLLEKLRTTVKTPITQITFRIPPKQKAIIKVLLVPIQILVIALDFLYCKDNNLIVFGSNIGQYKSGSPKALYDYVQDKQNTFRGFFYAPFELKSTAQELIMSVVKFAPIFFRARYLVSSHPPMDFVPFIWWSRRKVLINVWHGGPVKAIFFADADEKLNDLRTVKSLNKRTNIFVVASQLEAALISEEFQLNPKKFQYLGHPRNDILLSGASDNKIVTKTIRNVPTYKKVILYCPTYRRDNSVEILPFGDLDTEKLFKFLEESEAIMLIRQHLMAKLIKTEYLSNRIIDFGFDICPDINPALPEIDVLVTDYSSIYIDYLLLNRPCIFIPYDIEQYKERRGLLLDDYDFWAPGYKVKTFEEFLKALEFSLSGQDVHKAHREEICRQFNYYQTDRSCEKILNILKMRHKHLN